jgi:hypothetical protein
VQNASSVSGQVGHLLQGAARAGRTPHSQLILREAVRRDQLLLVTTPLQTAHLTLRVNRLRQRTCLRVKQTNVTIGSAATGGQDMLGVRAPGQRLDSRVVLSKAETRRLSVRVSRGVDVPDVANIV